MMCSLRTLLSRSSFIVPTFIFLILSLIILPYYIFPKEKASIYGRVWGPDKVLAVKAHVFVVNMDFTFLYADNITGDGVDKDTGIFQISNLPANENLYVVVFHKNFPELIALQQIKLLSGDHKKLTMNINYILTDPDPVSDRFGPGGFIKRMIILLDIAIHTESALAIQRMLRETQELFYNSPQKTWHLYSDCDCVRCTQETWVDDKYIKSVGYGSGNVFIGSFIGSHKVTVVRECDGVRKAILSKTISPSNGSKVQANLLNYNCSKAEINWK